MSPAQRLQIPIISLFAGAGGMDLGLQYAGFESVLALDHNQTAIDSFNANFANRPARRANLADKRVLQENIQAARDLGVRGVIGGPPCQGFSNGNVSKSKNDPRNRLIYRFAQVVTELNSDNQLDFFLMENVSGLAGPSQSTRLTRLRRLLSQAGFKVFMKRVNAKNHGVAQDRRRILLIGVNERRFDLDELQISTSRIRTRTVREAIAGLPEPTFFERGLTPKDIKHHPNHWTMQPRSKRFETGNFNRWRSFRLLEWDQASPTVAYGNREVHIHPDGTRRLSIFEAMLLQGLPKRYVLHGNLSEQVTQVSNLVPPPVARAAGEAIRKIILNG